MVSEKDELWKVYQGLVALLRKGESADWREWGLRTAERLGNRFAARTADKSESPKVPSL
jgi:hypothetical protein